MMDIQVWWTRLQLDNKISSERLSYLQDEQWRLRHRRAAMQLVAQPASDNYTKFCTIFWDQRFLHDNVVRCMTSTSRSLLEVERVCVDARGNCECLPRNFGIELNGQRFWYGAAVNWDSRLDFALDKYAYTGSSDFLPPSLWLLRGWCRAQGCAGLCGSLI